MTRAEMQQRIDDLEEESETLNEKLESIQNIASGDESVEEDDDLEDEN